MCCQSKNSFAVEVPTTELTRNAILVVAGDLSFIMASNEDTLRVKSFPVFRSPEITVSMNSTEKTIQITYLKDNGFEHCNGSKRAVSGISFTLENMDDAQIAQEMIAKAQNDAGSISDMKWTGDEDTTAVTPEPKRSIALVNLWSPEGQQLSTARPISHAEENEGSETQDVSPLQHRSQPLSQSNLRRPHSNHGHGGLDSETASETSFLEAAQDRQAFARATTCTSQSSASNTQAASNFSARVDDAVARHKSLKLDPNAVVAGSLRSVEGTTTNAPHLPKDTAKQPLKSNPAKQNLLSRSDKDRSSRHAGVQQSHSVDWHRRNLTHVAVRPASSTSEIQQRQHGEAFFGSTASSKYAEEADQSSRRPCSAISWLSAQRSDPGIEVYLFYPRCPQTEVVGLPRKKAFPRPLIGTKTFEMIASSIFLMTRAKRSDLLRGHAKEASNQLVSLLPSPVKQEYRRRRRQRRRPEEPLAGLRIPAQISRRRKPNRPSPQRGNVDNISLQSM